MHAWSKNKNLYLLIISAFAFYTAISMLYPVISYNLTKLSVTSSVIGIIIGAYGIFKILGLSLSGKIVKKLWFKKSFICIYLMATFVLFGMSYNMVSWVVSSGFLLIGLFEGIILPLLFSVQDYTSAEVDEKLFIGLIISIPSLGMSSGAFLSGIISKTNDINYVYMWSGIIMLIAIGVIFFVNFERGVYKKEESSNKKKITIDGKFIVILLSAFWGSIIVTSFKTIMPIHFIEDVGWNLDKFSFLLSINYGVFATCAAFSWVVFPKNMNYYNSLSIALLGIGFFTATLIFIKGEMLIYAIFALEGVLGALLATSIRLGVRKLYQEEELVSAHGILGIFGDAGIILGPSMHFLLYDFNKLLTFIVYTFLAISLSVSIYYVYKTKNSRRQLSEVN